MEQLDDLGICKRIAEIECVDYSVHSAVSALAYTDEFDDVLWYNPLTDDALCFQLMIKYKVEFEPLIDCYSAYISTGNKGEFINESPNKAICIAIIEANK